jgi:hypothetical protein
VPTPDANKAKVKMLGGLRILLNILQTKKNADFKLQMAAGAALLNICDGDGTHNLHYHAHAHMEWA